MQVLRLHGARDLRLHTEPDPLPAPGESLLPNIRPGRVSVQTGCGMTALRGLQRPFTGDL